MQRSYVYEVWLALHPYHPHSSKNGQGNGHSVAFQMLNERRLWFQDHQVGWAGAICPPNPNSFSHFSEWVLTGEAPFLPFHCEILSQGWWWLRLGDKGKRIEKRFFSPTPKRREGRQKNHPQPPKTVWCLHPWWDRLSQINKLCTGKKWDWHSTHTMGANLLSVAAHHMGQTDKSKAPQPSNIQHLFRKNVQMLFNPESGFKVVVEMGYPASWNVSKMVRIATVIQPSHCLPSSVQLLL